MDKWKSTFQAEETIGTKAQRQDDMLLSEKSPSSQDCWVQQVAYCQSAVGNGSPTWWQNEYKLLCLRSERNQEVAELE